MIVNDDVPALVAATYAALGAGYEQQALLAAANADNPDPDLHAECTPDDALAAILHAVPDAAKSTKHSDTCWRTHASCLRDRIYSDLGWE